MKLSLGPGDFQPADSSHVAAYAQHHFMNAVASKCPEVLRSLRPLLIHAAKLDQHNRKLTEDLQTWAKTHCLCLHQKVPLWVIRTARYALSSWTEGHSLASWPRPMSSEWSVAVVPEPDLSVRVEEYWNPAEERRERAEKRIYEAAKLQLDRIAGLGIPINGVPIKKKDPQHFDYAAQYQCGGMTPSEIATMERLTEDNVRAISAAISEVLEAVGLTRRMSRGRPANPKIAGSTIR